MKSSVEPLQRLDDLGIATCLATGLAVAYSYWAGMHSAEFVSAIFSAVFIVPIYLFWGLAIGAAVASTPWALLSPILTILILVLLFLTLKFVNRRGARIAIAACLFCAQFAAVTIVANGIHFLERA